MISFYYFFSDCFVLLECLVQLVWFGLLVTVVLITTMFSDCLLIMV